MKELSKVNRFYGKYTEQLDIEITRPIVRHRGPWAIVDKARFDVVVYDAKTGEFIEKVSRSCEPMTPFGPWSVWRFSYAGKKYTSLVNDIYGFLTVREEEVVK